MIQTGFESRVKVQQIIDSQLPEFILDESPKASEFLKQYYISQEYQGGPVDIAENLDQYIQLDNLTSEVVVGYTTLEGDISSSSTSITVSSTRGFPAKYGLLKIDDEIITYTSISGNTFTGCVRGFSGVTNYHKDLQYSELVFSQSSASSHASGASVQNLSSLFLQEFYKKIKFSLTPGLEGLNFTDNLDVGNFIKEARTLYESKGTPESFRILFNVLYGETPSIINLEKYLIKPSDAGYIRRNVAIISNISGDPTKLVGQTIKKSTDEFTSAAVSEVETISRNGVTYYKLNFFVGYDDTYPNVTGTFAITPNTKVIEEVVVTPKENGTTVISVDSTVGFADSGSIFFGSTEIFYSDKSVNQFLGCYVKTSSSITIPKTSSLISNETYYGYEDGDLTKKVEFRITGVLSNLDIETVNYELLDNDIISPKNLGEIIERGSSTKEIFANSWIYNTSSRYQIESFVGNTITTKSSVDSSSLTVGDFVEILQRNTEIVIPGFENATVNSISANVVTINVSTSSLNSLDKYDIRRKIKKASSSIVPIDFGNDKVISDVQNVYIERPDHFYVASNSLPSYQIQVDVFGYDVFELTGYDPDTESYSIIDFNTEVSFINGDRVFYSPDINNPIIGLSEGSYFVEVLSNKRQIKLYLSGPVVGTDDFVYFGEGQSSTPSGTHNFTLYSQRSNKISGQKVLKKFKLNPDLGSNDNNQTLPGSIGMLKNGVEIYSFKTNDKIYYGPIDNVDVLNGGEDFDVVNPPLLELSYGTGLIQPVVIGSVQNIFVDPQDFNIDVIVSVALTGGNGSGASFSPIIEKSIREIEFDARTISNGGGLDIINDRISFASTHNLINGQPIVYDSNFNSAIGVGTFNGSNLNQSKTLISGNTYYTKVINDKTIEIYQSLSDYNAGINTVGFTTIGNSGIQRFKTEPKNKLTGISVINGGSGYANRLLRVSPIGISTYDHTITFKNHGFGDGEIVSYDYEISAISGLSTSNNYTILKLNSDKFRLCNAGIGGTDTSNYQRKNYVKFTSTGSGYQTFKYPDIELKVEYSSVGLGSTQVRGVINATPVIRGKISEVYVYNRGTDYGSTTLNVHKRPQIIIKNGKNAQFRPTIVNGRITDVQVLYGGTEYYSTPDLVITGSGIGAIIRPVVSNNKITDVIVVNPGTGYTSTNISIKAVSAGKNEVLRVNVRELTLNNSYKYGIQNEFYRNPSSEVLIENDNGLKYAVIGYSQNIKTNFNDNSDLSGQHSDIIGWAYDGNPIYGSFGYSDPNDINSSVKKLQPGYSIVTLENRPSTTDFPYGYFIEDYKYTENGDLDQYNGRFGKTKDFPEGVYAYFATTETNIDGEIVGKFPYFIGNEYRSPYLLENIDLNQSFNFNESNLLRNTLPYNVNEEYAGNDFIIESNEIIQQKTLVESVSTGSVSGFEIVKSGSDYSIGDPVIFDDTTSGGGGISAEVSRIVGKDIININTAVESYNNSILEWQNGGKIKVYISPYHNFRSGDNINISGLSTQVSDLNGSYTVGLTTYVATLDKNIPNFASTGIVTDIYLSSIPENISIGSSIQIENEIFSILNVYSNFGIVRVDRSSAGVSHTQTTPVYFLPDSFTVNKTTPYFDSQTNSKIYFNPTLSVGIGTTTGSGVSVNYSIGITTYTTFIPTQSIFLPNHPFKTNQQVVLRKPSGSSAISVSNTPGSLSFNILSGSSEVVYVINKSKDYIGIVTNVGLTTTGGLFFQSKGTDDYHYSIESNLPQVKAKVNKILSVVSVSTSHQLRIGDEVNLEVKPNLTVGIGSSTSINVRLNSLTQKIVLNPLEFTSTGINTVTNTISINSHNLKTGDKILYESLGTLPSGISTGNYFAYRVDENTIKLCETLFDSFNSPPHAVSIGGTGSGNQKISLVNPQIRFTKNNNIVFNLSDSSLLGYDFKIYYDSNFTKEFVSIATTESLSVIGVGTIGLSSTASLTLNYSEGVPEKLYYNLEKSGYISTADTDVANYSEIVFENSQYNGQYSVVSVGNTTFTISLKQIPENTYYDQNDCDVIQYSTTSQTATGGIHKVRLLSGGSSYTSLPLFDRVDSENGSGAFIVPVSTTIGKLKQSRIINEGFEYSSDKTLRPTASIPQFAYISSSNTIDTINILNGGQNYTSPPDLICVNSDSGELIDSGLLRANLSGSSIVSVTIENEPKGLPINPVTIRAINNSNGISINTIQSSSGVVTCFLTTPLAGFTSAPFAIGDRIFVEGIQKSGSAGDGFNSSNYGYQFFTVTNFQNINPAKLEFNLSGLSTNPGIAKTIQESYATIINFNSYPQFESIQKFSPFAIGEKLSSNNENGFAVRDLIVVNCDENFVRVSGNYKLSEGEVIKGTESSNLATIDSVKTIDGVYNVDYFNLQEFGWKSDTGKLSENFQVTSDNDYYQNLSYSVKSSKTWEEIVTPVNNLLHISGTKNFADTQILQSVQSGIGTTESTLSLLNVFESDNRVDTINNLDLVVDIDTFENKSKFIKFNNASLSDYILCKTNRVLKIDDISSLFSSENDESIGVSNISQINSGNNYNRFLIQTRNIFTNETQFTELITINDDQNIFTLQKASLSSLNSENGLANIEGYIDINSNFYLRFEPEDINNSDFDIKILQDTFTSKTGVGTTQSVGFVDLISANKIVSSGITTSIFDLNSSKYSAIYSNIHILNSDSSNMNYVEVYLTHDGTNTYISEYYFDDDLTESSSSFIGSFGASITGGILSLNYTNTSSETITVRTKNVGFGTTAVGTGNYRFKLPGQSDGNERTVVFQSQFNNISSGSTSILVLDKSLFTSSKSVVKVGLGETSALHQIMAINEGNNSYSVQYPFLSIGSTSGIGTFGAEISGNDFIVKFYADPSISGNLEILSFSENFYTQLDTVNIPPALNYTPVQQSVKVAKYFGANSVSINKYDFEAKYEGVPIFMKTFNPSDSDVLNPVTGVFTISNHFFNTGEQLIYTPKSSFIGIGTSAMGIGATANYVGVVTTILPSVVYAIKDSNDTFRLSTRQEYASLGIGVTFTSFGLGNAHQLEMYKKNEKSIITINDVVQSPLAYSNITHTLSGNGGQIGTASTIFAISGISSITPTDILKVDNEYMRVENVGLGTTNVGPITFNGSISLVEVTRGFVGSTAGVHTDTSTARIYRGSYNIAESTIFFTEAPRGNSLDLLGPSESNLPRERASFSGRVFLREDYTTNQVYDDISDQFTGIGQTFILTTQGINTVGLGTSGGSGIVFINNIFQSPTTFNNSSNNYFVTENLGITSITFTGITSTNDSLFTSEYDINQNQLPRGGVIVSLGSTGGLGIAPLVGASVTAVVGAGGTIVAIGIGTMDIIGSGYRYPVSVAVTESGHIGTGAVITANVGAGGTLSFNVVNPGTGYTNPTINVSSPSYENLPITGVSRLGIGSTTDTGIGLLLNIEVGASSTTTGIGSTLFEVKTFKITRNGYSFRVGDVFKPVGLVTAKGLSSPISEFELTVLDVFTDSFSSWQFGELDYIDSLKQYQDGIRTRFPLFYNSELLSFEIDENDPDSQLIDLDSVLLIFINGVLQEPGVSYQFSGGTSFTFSVAPEPEDDIAVFFYRGTRDQDTLQINAVETIKVGDTVQIFSNNANIENTITQDKRIIYDISASDKIETNLYTNQGVDEVNNKPLYWTKQKTDLILNGETISKSRDSLESQIYPTANIIGNFNNSTSEIFVDDSSLFNYENQSPINFDAFIFSNDSAEEYEIITDISDVEGYDVSIIGIETTNGIGAPLALKFTLDRDPFSFPDLQVGYPVYISETSVGQGVTSINTSNTDIVAISTSFLNNIYQIHAINSTLGIITCNIASNTSIVGIATTGTLDYPIGRLSWGRLSGFSRSANPISIGVTGYTSSVGITTFGYNAGLSTYPIIQRRGYGLRSNGSLKKDL
ncbi:virion structural protein [Synechococcus phage S-SRM01]|uniref:Baseplate wedge initiator n=1 Tax=Synechococcus phage S-SRM01 TaxID=2781608 RepID=A0A879R2N0_9CAUD|nr:virion structural protein [Synechococcus phage S-SRM01]QPX48159.1 baseplate wedge initiator [Synechococcus phage S-SRM01]